MKKRILILITFLSLILIMAGCGSDYDDVYYEDSYQEVDTEPVAPDPVVTTPDLAGGETVQTAAVPALENRKIIYIASLNMESPDPEAIYNNVIDNLDTYTAYIESANITSLRYTIKIRVLSENFTDFVEEIKTAGDILSYTKTSEDVTNSYSTFEARKLALETQHARILELISVAVDLDDILTLEDARFEIETELNEIGESLANFDSLVDFSTITLTIYKTSETEVILPRTSEPTVSVLGSTKDSVEIEVFNHEEVAVIIYVDLLQNGEFIRQYEQAAYGDSKAVFAIGDLKSNTDYTFKVTAISSENRVSYIVSRSATTNTTFINDITNIFRSSIGVLVTVLKFLGLAFVALSPFLFIGALFYIPGRLLYKKVKPTLDDKRNKRLALIDQRRKEREVIEEVNLQKRRELLAMRERQAALQKQSQNNRNNNK
ncbi:MAG: DUF4349 domain-containing protein [Candidatus Izemoplasma sp.]